MPHGGCRDSKITTYQEESTQCPTPLKSLILWATTAFISPTGTVKLYARRSQRDDLGHSKTVTYINSLAEVQVSKVAVFSHFYSINCGAFRVCLLWFFSVVRRLSIASIRYCSNRYSIFTTNFPRNYYYFH